jgi:triacylglycerol lipase
MRLGFTTLLAAAAAGLALPVAAQVPAELAAQIRGIGRTVDTLKTGALYAPLQEPLPASMRATRDLKFGTDPKQTLDVVAPATASGSARPVFLFVHGGGYVRGDKTLDETGKPSIFYDNIMIWAVKNGMIGVNVNYRLAPQFQYPAVQQDLGAAVKWVQDNIGRYGGDPGKLYMMGHSAGAAHVASYVAHPEFGPGGQLGLKAAVFSSGNYEFAPAPGQKAGHPYFGAQAAEHSSLPGLTATKTPYLVIVAELDPVGFHEQAGKLMNAVCAAGNCPPYLLLRDHGHMSGNYAVNTADTSLSGAVLEFLKKSGGLAR